MIKQETFPLRSLTYLTLSTDVRFWRIYKDGPRTERMKKEKGVWPQIFLMVVDPYHSYSNESEIAN